MAAAPGAPSAQDGGPRLALSGATFTKWLYGSLQLVVERVLPDRAEVHDGVALRPRFRNGVVGAKAGVHLGPWADLRAAR